MTEENLTPPSRRTQVLMALAAVVLLLMVFGFCAVVSFVVPKMQLSDPTGTPIVVITGTVGQIAGMPIPPDAVMMGQTLRSNGGTFDYKTALRPQQVYLFYYGMLTQRGLWRAGSQPTITPDRGEFQFSTVMPRLTLISVNCDISICTVHVDY